MQRKCGDRARNGEGERAAGLDDASPSGTRLPMIDQHGLGISHPISIPELTDLKQYLEAHNRAERWFLSRKGEYVWTPPSSMKEWEGKLAGRIGRARA